MEPCFCFVRLKTNRSTLSSRMLVLPESPRFLMYKDRTVDSYRVWRRIRDLSTDEAKAEFFVMKEAVQLEMKENAAKGVGSRWVYFDFITYVHSILRDMTYTNLMQRSSCSPRLSVRQHHDFAR